MIGHSECNQFLFGVGLTLFSQCLLLLDVEPSTEIVGVNFI
jgi:hypothetical protein